MSEQFVQINVTGSRARRLTYPACGKGIIEYAQLIDIKDENVTLKTLYSGISKGTESLVFNGNVPESEWTRMQCPFMTGSFAFPITYGYACVCEVMECGKAVENLELGDRVFILHPHQDLMCVPASACHKLPDIIPTKRGVLSANMETGLNSVWDAEISGKPACAVIGAGVVGLMTAHALRETTGVSPIVLDVNPAKEKIISKLGFNFANPSRHTDLNLPEFEFLFHTSASSEGLQTAIDLAGFEARIVELSWYGEKPVSLLLGGAFHSKRLRIIASQVGSIAPAMRAELDQSERIKQAMALLDDPRLDSLLETEIEFSEVPDHLHDLLGPQSDILCQVIRYTD
ncbi:MAG: zinc-dependent alcohol dehydrogenase [Rhizobiaceae bacterium]